MQLQLKETQAGRRASDLAAVGDAEQARVRIVTHAAQLRQLHGARPSPR